jgi:hypothetical protein
MRFLYLLLPLLLLSMVVLRFYQIGSSRPSTKGSVSIEGTIEAPLDTYRGELQFSVNGHQVFSSHNTSAKLAMGDRIIVVGNYQERVINPLYSEKWLHAQDIRVVQKYDEKSVKISGISGLMLVYRIRLHEIKQSVVEVYRQLFSLNSAGLMAGMVLGEGSEIPYSLYESMKESGLAHLVVASGSNIALVAGASMGIVSFLSKNTGILLVQSPYCHTWLWRAWKLR